MKAQDPAKVSAESGGVLHRPVEAFGSGDHGNRGTLDMLPGAIGMGERAEGSSNRSLEGVPGQSFIPDAFSPFSYGQKMGVERGICPPTHAAVSHDECEVEILTTGPRGRGGRGSGSTPLSEQDGRCHPCNGLTVGERRNASRAEESFGVDSDRGEPSIAR